MTAAGGLHDLGDRPQLFGIAHLHDAYVIPLDDLAEIGESDAPVFLEHPLRGDPELGGALADFVQPGLRGFAPPAFLPERLDQLRYREGACGAGSRPSPRPILFLFCTRTIRIGDVTLDVPSAIYGIPRRGAMNASAGCNFGFDLRLSRERKTHAEIDHVRFTCR